MARRDAYILALLCAEKDWLFANPMRPTTSTPDEYVCSFHAFAVFGDILKGNCYCLVAASNPSNLLHSLHQIALVEALEVQFTSRFWRLKSGKGR